MDDTKYYKFIGFGAVKVTKPFRLLWFGAMDVAKPCEFVGFGSWMSPNHALCYSVVLPGRISVFRAGFWPASMQEDIKIGPPAGLGQPEGR
jgi:hypothetical protein